MITSYFLSSVRNNIGKTILLVLSVAIYFSLLSLMITLARNMDAIAGLPFKAIGADVIVQKTGKIPEHMSGAIYPHSNGPIYPDEVDALSKLDFVEKTDAGLYFWYFDSSSFKDVFGIQLNGPIYPNMLKSNLEEGKDLLDEENVLITKDFAQRNSLSIGDKVTIGQNTFIVSGILRSNMTGNVIPADIYMDYASALKLAHESVEMDRLFHDNDRDFVNVILFKIKPQFKGDIQKTITGISKDYLVFSEKTFSSQLIDQIKLISSFGQTVFLMLGILLLIAYGFMTLYNIKTREREISILRIIGWSANLVKRQFLSESIILVVIALLIGNIFAYFGIYIISRQKITMEIPWELSAKPHFLPQANSIDRVVTSTIPIYFDWHVFLLCSLAFILILVAINFVLFKIIKNIKPEVRSG
jgi:ABC-type lipoprotein release transport system permease subunit